MKKVMAEFLIVGLRLEKSIKKEKKKSLKKVGKGRTQMAVYFDTKMAAHGSHSRNRGYVAARKEGKGEGKEGNGDGGREKRGRGKGMEEVGKEEG